MKPFSELVKECGMSVIGASLVLDVSYDTVKSWNLGRRNCPQDIRNKLEKISDFIESLD